MMNDDSDNDDSDNDDSDDDGIETSPCFSIYL